MKDFFDFQDKKITEKAFSQNIIISVAGILLSIIMLCSSTYAWFTASVLSDTNKVESGHFSIDVVSVAPVVNDVVGDAVTPDASGKYTLAEGKYMITLAPTVESTVKGYCLITVNGESYRTDIIVNDNTVTDEYPTSNSPFVFYIIVAESTTLNVESRWGIPANVDILADSTIDTTVTLP